MASPQPPDNRSAPQPVGKTAGFPTQSPVTFTPSVSDKAVEDAARALEKAAIAANNLIPKDLKEQATKPDAAQALSPGMAPPPTDKQKQQAAKQDKELSSAPQETDPQRAVREGGELLDKRTKEKKKLAAHKQSFEGITGKARASLDKEGEVGQLLEAGGQGEGRQQLDDKLGKAQTVARAAAGDPIAIAQTAKMAADEVKERGKAVYEGGKGLAEGGMRAAQSTQAGDVVGNLAGGGENAFAGAAKATEGTGLEYAAKAGEGLMALTKGAAGVVEGLRNWNDALFQGNMKFAEFSASMTQVEVENEIKAMNMSRERGEAQAASAREQAEARYRLNKALQPFETWWANTMNKLSTGIIDRLIAVLDKLGIGEDKPIGEDNRGMDAGDINAAASNIARDTILAPRDVIRAIQNGDWSQVYGNTRGNRNSNL